MDLSPFSCLAGIEDKTHRFMFHPRVCPLHSPLSPPCCAIQEGGRPSGTRLRDTPAVGQPIWGPGCWTPWSWSCRAVCPPSRRRAGVKARVHFWQLGANRVTQQLGRARLRFEKKCRLFTLHGAGSWHFIVFSERKTGAVKVDAALHPLIPPARSSNSKDCLETRWTEHIDLSTSHHTHLVQCSPSCK
jgi:hypothetical protein